jgi:dTDP-3-amino-3,4,6-trideoxy-alpha-D-glucose transaminase
MNTTGTYEAAAAGTILAPVPFTRLDNSDPQLLTELMEAVERVAEKAAFTLGEEVEAFEEEFAAWCGAKHGIGVSSGTAALELAMRGLGIGPGDEVIVPTNSFIATAEAVSATGAKPVLVDVDEETALLTTEIVEQAITSNTRCVIPVHLYGRTVEMDPLRPMAPAIATGQRDRSAMPAASASIRQRTWARGATVAPW